MKSTEYFKLLVVPNNPKRMLSSFMSATVCPLLIFASVIFDLELFKALLAQIEVVADSTSVSVIREEALTGITLSSCRGGSLCRIFLNYSLIDDIVQLSVLANEDKCLLCFGKSALKTVALLSSFL